MAKTVNYTSEQVARLQDVYNPAASEVERKAMVASLAAEFDKKPNSIIAKLSNMKIYVPKPVAVSTVTGMEAQKKDAMAQTISDLIEENFERPDNVHAVNVETLAKANKTDLSVIILALQFAFPEEVEPSAEIVRDAIADGDTIETVS